MTLNIKRNEAYMLVLACLGIAHENEIEAADINTTEDRRKVCIETAKMWRELHNEIKKQAEEHDNFEEWKRIFCKG